MKQGLLRQQLKQYEYQLIYKAIYRDKGNITLMSNYLGIDRRNMVTILRRHNLREEQLKVKLKNEE